MQNITFTTSRCTHLLQPRSHAPTSHLLKSSISNILEFFKSDFVLLSWCLFYVLQRSCRGTGVCRLSETPGFLFGPELCQDSLHTDPTACGAPSGNRPVVCENRSASVRDRTMVSRYPDECHNCQATHDTVTLRR